MIERLKERNKMNKKEGKGEKTKRHRERKKGRRNEPKKEERRKRTKLMVIYTMHTTKTFCLWNYWHFVEPNSFASIYFYSHFNSYHCCIVYIHVFLRSFLHSVFFSAAAAAASSPALNFFFCCCCVWLQTCMHFSLCYRTCLHCTITDVGSLRVFSSLVCCTRTAKKTEKHHHRHRDLIVWNRSGLLSSSLSLASVIVAHYLYHCHWPFNHI